MAATINADAQSTALAKSNLEANLEILHTMNSICLSTIQFFKENSDMLKEQSSEDQEQGKKLQEIVTSTQESASKLVALTTAAPTPEDQMITGLLTNDNAMQASQLALTNESTTVLKTISNGIGALVAINKENLDNTKVLVIAQKEQEKAALNKTGKDAGAKKKEGGKEEGSMDIDIDKVISGVGKMFGALFNPVAIAMTFIAQMLPWILIFGAVLIGMLKGLSLKAIAKITVFGGIALAAFLAALVVFKVMQFTFAAVLSGMSSTFSKIVITPIKKKLAKIGKQMAVAMWNWLANTKLGKKLHMKEAALITTKKADEKIIFTTQMKNENTSFLAKMKTTITEAAHNAALFVKKTALHAADMARSAASSIMNVFHHNARMAVTVAEGTMNTTTFFRRIAVIIMEMVQKTIEFVRSIALIIMKIIQAVAVFIMEIALKAFQYAATAASVVLIALAVVAIVLIVALIIIVMVKAISYVVKAIAESLAAIVAAVMPIIIMIMKPFMYVIINLVTAFSIVFAAAVTAILTVSLAVINGFVTVMLMQFGMVAIMAAMWMPIIGGLTLLITGLVAALAAMTVALIFGRGGKNDKDKVTKDNFNSRLGSVQGTLLSINEKMDKIKTGFDMTQLMQAMSIAMTQLADILNTMMEEVNRSLHVMTGIMTAQLALQALSNPFVLATTMVTGGIGAVGKLADMASPIAQPTDAVSSNTTNSTTNNTTTIGGSSTNYNRIMLRLEELLKKIEENTAKVSIATDS